MTHTPPPKAFKAYPASPPVTVQPDPKFFSWSQSVAPTVPVTVKAGSGVAIHLNSVPSDWSAELSAMNVIGGMRT